MDFGSEVKVNSWITKIGNLGLQLLWHLLHFVVSTWYCLLGTTHLLESYVIASGILKRYKSLNLSKLRYLAIVVESEEARQTSEVIELLLWLEAIGVKHVCLYDMEGVLKKSKEAILENLSKENLLEVASENDALINQRNITLEFCSFSDGREAVAKAANVLFVKYTELGNSSRDQEEPLFTEPQMASALRTVGFGDPDPDLLLVYGPARCHLGFPAWRLRYTEIVVEVPRMLESMLKLKLEAVKAEIFLESSVNVEKEELTINLDRKLTRIRKGHMGSLKSRKYGSLVKAIYKFTMVRQNYGK